MTFPAEFNFDPPAPASHFLARCAERLGAWRRKRRWLAEMNRIATRGRLDEVLADLGLTRAQFAELKAAPADAGRQFEIMAAMEGLDLERLPAGVLRDAMWKCARCDCADACKRWLRAGEWRHEGDPRCPNAGLLDQR